MFLFVIAFFVIMLWRYLPTLRTYPWSLNLWYLLAGCLIYTLDLLLVVFCWQSIMQQLGAPLTFREHLRIYCLTFVAGRLPGAPWHIAGRALLYKDRGIDAGVTGVAAGLELVLVIVSGLISGLLIWFILPEAIQRSLAWLALVPFLGVGLMHPRVIRQVMRRLGHIEQQVRPRFRHMLLLLLLYLVVWGIGGLVLYTVIVAIYPLPFGGAPAVVGAWGLSGAIASLSFLSPISLGLREIALSLLLALIIPAGIALVVAILVRLALTATELVWAAAATRL